MVIEPKDIDLNLLVVFQEIFEERQISSALSVYLLTYLLIYSAAKKTRQLFRFLGLGSLSG